MSFSKIDKDFSDFAKIQAYLLSKSLTEEKRINEIKLILLLSRFSSAVSEEYLLYSSYIPLRVIAKEIIKERHTIENGIKELYAIENNTVKAKHFFKKLFFKETKVSIDKMYLYLMNKNDKFTVKEIRKIQKCVNDSEFEKMLNDIFQSAKNRIKKYKYLSAVLK